MTTITIESDTPGFTAVIKSSNNRAGPFRPISRQHTIETRTTIALQSRQPARYYLIWITNLAATSGPRYHADIENLEATRLPSRPPPNSSGRAAIAISRSSRKKLRGGRLRCRRRRWVTTVRRLRRGVEPGTLVRVVYSNPSNVAIADQLAASSSRKQSCGSGASSMCGFSMS